MATDLERLVVSLEANIRGYERNLQKAMGVTNSRTRNIERRFQSMNSNITRSLGRAGALLGAGFGARAAQQLVDASTRITNALKVAGLEGMALTAVYDRLYKSAQDNAAPLESLVTLYGRAAIVQKELGVTTEELLGFTDSVAVALRVAGTDAQSASGALLQLSQALGSGVVRAEEFNSILEGALPIAQAAAAGLDEAGGSVAKLRGLIIEGKVSSEAFFRAFEAGSVILQDKVASSQFTVAQGFVQIKNAMVDAAGRMNEGTQAGKQLADSLASIAEAIRNTDFDPLVSGLATFIGDVRTAIRDLAAFKQALSSGDFGAAFKALGFGRTSQAPIENTERRGQAGMVGRTAAATGGPVAGAVSLGDFAAPSGKDGKKARENEWQRETRQIQEATAALQVELGLIGQTEFARDKARAALELENAARRAGVQITDEYRSKIDQLSTSYAMAAENVRAAEDRFEAINELQREFGQLAIDGIMGLIDGTKSLNDVLADTLKRMGELALQAAILGEGPFATLFGGGGSGGGVGGIVGMIGKAFGGFFADGGNLGAGKWGIAGENGPEVIKGPAQVIPNSAMKTMGGGTSVQISQSFDFRGADPGMRAYIEGRLAQVKSESVRAAVAAVPAAAAKRPSYYGSGR